MLQPKPERPLAQRVLHQAARGVTGVDSQFPKIAPLSKAGGMFLTGLKSLKEFGVKAKDRIFLRDYTQSNTL